MGKRIISQSRGHGGPRYRSPSHNYKVKISHLPYNIKGSGLVKDFIHCPGHSAPLAEVVVNKEKIYFLAPEGIRVGDEISFLPDAEIKPGNTLILKNIPEGTSIYNIELKPGDGGKLIRAGGTSAKLISKTSKIVTVLLPSKKERKFNPECRAAIGVIAGSGKKEKPFTKAGKKHHAMKARNRLFPKVSAVCMNAVDHPFGSGRGKHIGKPKNAPKFAPPGRKVGLIRAKRSGMKR